MYFVLISRATRKTAFIFVSYFFRLCFFKTREVKAIGTTFAYFRQLHAGDVGQDARVFANFVTEFAIRRL